MFRVKPLYINTRTCTVLLQRTSQLQLICTAGPCSPGENPPTQSRMQITHGPDTDK